MSAYRLYSQPLANTIAFLSFHSLPITHSSTMTAVKCLSFLILVSALFTSHALIYKDCGSVYGKVRSVAVSGCENSNVCILKSGQNANLTVVFTSLEDTDKTKASVHGIIGGVPLPFPLPQTDACQNSGLDCPINNGQNYTYTAIIPISSAYPKIKVLVKWELQESHGKDLFCVEIPSAIL